MLVITDKFRHLESIYNIKYWLNYFVSADTPKLEKIFKMMEENIIDMFSITAQGRAKSGRVA
jgi:hypothetical protein